MNTHGSQLLSNTYYPNAPMCISHMQDETQRLNAIALFRDDQKAEVNSKHMATTVALCQHVFFHNFPTGNTWKGTYASIRQHFNRGHIFI